MLSLVLCVHLGILIIIQNVLSCVSIDCMCTYSDKIYGRNSHTSIQVEGCTYMFVIDSHMLLPLALLH